MKAIVKNAPQSGVSIVDIPKPIPGDGELLVRVIYGSICGTDIGIYDWNPWAESHIVPPIVIGHEIVGEVVEINGDGGAIAVGDIVSSETHIFDDTCPQCLMGNRHVCENIELFGIGRDGGFAEYATIPIRTSWKNDLRIPLKAMSVQEPLGNAVHAVQKGNVKGKRVLVIGLGPVGLCAAAASFAYGAAEVVGIDPQEYRRNVAESFTTLKTFDKLPEELHGMFDVVIEASGAIPAILSTFDAVRIAGKIVAVGIPKSEISIDWAKQIIDKEITIESIFGRRIWETWDQVTELLTSGKVDLLKIITHEFPLDEFEEAMKIMKSGESGKIVLKIGEEPSK